MSSRGDDFRLLIQSGNVKNIRRALAQEPALANATIHWVLNQKNASDPLHFVSDCVSHGWLTAATEGEIAQALLEHGAALEGSAGRESPLIAAVSLGAEQVTRVLLQAGAELERTSVFGARALHWAAWTGAPTVVDLLLNRGAQLEPRCSEFGATPLFWAVHGYGPNGPNQKQDQLGAARRLIHAGAKIDTRNNQGLSALELSGTAARRDMYELLTR